MKLFKCRDLLSTVSLQKYGNIGLFNRAAYSNLSEKRKIIIQQFTIKCKFLSLCPLDSGAQCSAELEALYDVYMEQSADFEQRESSSSEQKNGEGSLNTLQKVNRAWSTVLQAFVKKSATCGLGNSYLKA